ncbi:diacylglycerol kinase family protein [Dubosiella newyorkensis]|jgi:undecaprenol kinase|uniref:diacylglycerol kinase family protein n=2 Tax=Dubosiella newyorkensis TaxID=1862672 RepID=UPI002355B556|nr:diacylglycerol kinase family protein [Dubosiella newyorkensis]MCI9040643.1 diacylglycerol kinase family protein [Dubosiella newyorkensis]
MKWFRDRFRYAFAGIRYGVLKDRSIVLQIVFGWIAIVVAFVLRCTFYEWLWILLCITLVVVGEIFNSCIEQCVDYISLEIDPRAKKIKDMAAAAVFLICVFAGIVGCLIFIPKIGEVVFYGL